MYYTKILGHTVEFMVSKKYSHYNKTQIFNVYLDQLSNKSCPLLFASLVVSLQVAIVARQTDVQTVGEVTGHTESLQQIYTISSTAVATSVMAGPGLEDIFWTLYPLILG